MSPISVDRREGRRERFLSQAELARLGDALREAERDKSATPWAIAAIRLLTFTGARLNEILSLRWEHVSEEHASLFLPDSKTGRKAIHLNAPAIRRLMALYDPGWTPEQRTKLIGYSADFEELAEWVGEGWRASDPSGAAPVCTLLARRARRRRSLIKLEHAKHWLARTQSPEGRSSLVRETAQRASISRSEVTEMHPPQNNKLVNLVARRWLKKGKVQPDPHSLHLLTLARWGLENGAEGDWPDDLRDVVEMQLDDLAQWRSEHSRGRDSWCYR